MFHFVLLPILSHNFKLVPEWPKKYPRVVDHDVQIDIEIIEIVK